MTALYDSSSHFAVWQFLEVYCQLGALSVAKLLGTKWKYLWTGLYYNPYMLTKYAHLCCIAKITWTYASSEASLKHTNMTMEWWIIFNEFFDLLYFLWFRHSVCASGCARSLANPPEWDVPLRFLHKTRQTKSNQSLYSIKYPSPINKVSLDIDSNMRVGSACNINRTGLKRSQTRITKGKKKAWRMNESCCEKQ